MAESCRNGLVIEKNNEFQIITGYNEQVITSLSSKMKRSLTNDDVDSVFIDVPTVFVSDDELHTTLELHHTTGAQLGKEEVKLHLVRMSPDFFVKIRKLCEDLNLNGGPPQQEGTSGLFALKVVRMHSAGQGFLIAMTALYGRPDQPRLIGRIVLEDGEVKLPESVDGNENFALEDIDPKPEIRENMTLTSYMWNERALVTYNPARLAHEVDPEYAEQCNTAFERMFNILRETELTGCPGPMSNALLADLNKNGIAPVDVGA